MNPVRLAILSTHPVQYNAPMFALLAQSNQLDIKVFYTWSQSQESLFDKDFGKQIQWDIPLLEGYSYQFVPNKSANPGLHSFQGIDCPDLIEQLKDWNAEALLVFGWNFKAHLKAMRYFKGKIPVYFRGDSTLLDEHAGLKAMIRRTVLRFVYRYADYAFYVGKNNKAYFLAHGLTEKNIFFAPHAIDNERFGNISDTVVAQAASFRTELGIKPEELIFLFVGKFEPKKNPLLLLDAFKELGFPRAHLVFVGNGMLEAELKQQAGNHPTIHWVPFKNQSEMPAVYYMADVLVLPSQGPGETWGLAVNEAMACGKAVLVSDKVGCAVDLVVQGHNGFMFPSGDKKSLQSAILRFKEEPDLHLQMGKNSRLKIADWSFREIVNSLEKWVKRKS